MTVGSPPQRKIWQSLVLLLIIAAVALIGWRWKAPTDKPGQAVTIWLVNMGLLLIFTVIVGHVITGFLRGVLIDSSNKISLARLQMLLWTFLILAGFLTAVLVNIHRGRTDPLDIALDPELWALLGISTTSLVGSPLIKNNKKAEPTNEAAKTQTMMMMADQGIDASRVQAEGQILTNRRPEDARWTDIFKGEETGNGAHLDLGKIQMFFFTLVTWFAYALTFGHELQESVPQAQGFAAFPTLDKGMVALLGISHAAYLANKAVPHTPPPPAGSP